MQIRAAMFTILVPGVVGGVVPYFLHGPIDRPEGALPFGGALILAGAALYLACLRRFLDAGGTPNMFFLRPLGPVIGEEPHKMVRGGPYRFSRNPMYVAVLIAIFGQAFFYWSGAVALYGLAMFVIFTAVIAFIEEPHLKKRYGPHYEDFQMRVPRWF